MPRVLLIATAAILLSGLATFADAKATKATFAVSGLHWGGWAKTLEASLAKTKGIKSAKVSMDTRQAAVEFDESKTSAQALARAVAATPHMMGAGHKYSAALLLKVEGMKDEASAKKIKDALARSAGVGKVEAHPKAQTATVEFAAKGNATTRQLLQAASKSGLKAALM